MYLSSIHLKNFRNYTDTALENICAKNIFLVGENGQGKTNFLEAVYYVSYASSFRNVKTEVLTRHNEDAFFISAHLKEEDIIHTIISAARKKKKRILYNNNLVTDRQEIAGVFPTLIFKHSDIFFVSGAPEYQRQFVDQTIALAHIDYVLNLRKYKKTAAQKTAALKHAHYDLIPTYNKILAERGVEIMRSRAEALRFFTMRVGALFSHVFTHTRKPNTIDDKTHVRITYAPSWKSYDAREVYEHLARVEEREKMLSFCLSGPHKDKVEFSMGGHSFKDCASTGQIRLLSLLIRALQAEYYHNITGKRMVYLFDDVLLELDAVKRAMFLNTLPEATQNFFTFLPDEKLPETFLSEAQVYTVCNNTIAPRAG